MHRIIINMLQKYRHIRLFLYLVMAAYMMLNTACSSSKHAATDSLTIGKTEVVSEDRNVDVSFLQPYIKTKSKNIIQPIDGYLPEDIKKSPKDSTKWYKRMLKEWAKQPKVYDSLEVLSTCEKLKSLMQNNGYMNADVTFETKKRGNGNRLNVKYIVHPGEPFFIHNINYVIEDTAIAEILTANNQLGSVIKAGLKFSTEELDRERQHITTFLRDNGYYKFNKDFIHFDADTVSGSRLIDLTLYLSQYVLNDDDFPHPHTRYKINNVDYSYSNDTHTHIRQKIIENNMFLKAGDYYSARKLQQSYNNYSRLHAIRYTNIRFTEVPDTNLLDAKVRISTNKPSTISFQPEGTNTAGNLGAAATLTYENRNIFRGSETFTMQLRAAFEAITGLEGYQNKDYEEYNIESKLSFPRLIVPFLSLRNKLHTTATSELAVSYNLQNRPEFHRRVFAAAWRYKWKSPSNKYSYKIDLPDLNYIYMPWIAPTFKQNYLDDVHSRNAILRYNYEDLFIMKTGFVFSFSSSRQAMRLNVETSGNLLNLISRVGNASKNAQKQYTFFNIAYAQYAKFDFDYSFALSVSKSSMLVMHTGFGIAYPYSNSKILPFEKRYFSGGPNSVRGWGVRELGPGRYHKNDGAIDFINQTGDMKLDLNLEYRMPLFWKFSGAVFVDAGNVWTLRNYDEQAGGQFKLKNLLRDMAVAYGVGLRLNFDYFILRFDMGMKAINPDYQSSDEHYAIVHPDLSRDFAFHFAVGLPF